MVNIILFTPHYCRPMRGQSNTNIMISKKEICYYMARTWGNISTLYILHNIYYFCSSIKKKISLSMRARKYQKWKIIL